MNKVKCVKNEGLELLITINKEYKVIEFDNYFAQIRDDKGGNTWIGHDFFEKTVKEKKEKHYKTNSIDVIDICKLYSLNFNKGNIVKYICRAGKKENTPELVDLKKALDYIQREIKHLENK